ncbi:hypothetical protein CDD80_6422 [Ophiocordyceps camponoti-rufipedis]|uniref:Uncharacterized protein n=1 Tax=Ophiocordyceps camponoti-rufipedis TaxID=2004952 RepID=A0A2C5ZM05_9HYPO|nr:hypothetical protein CDD80_6422 [Ophiocordyceps camponoti-rufipedis]
MLDSRPRFLSISMHSFVIVRHPSDDVIGCESMSHPTSAFHCSFEPAAFVFRLLALDGSQLVSSRGENRPVNAQRTQTSLGHESIGSPNHEREQFTSRLLVSKALAMPDDWPSVDSPESISSGAEACSPRFTPLCQLPATLIPKTRSRPSPAFSVTRHVAKDDPRRSVFLLRSGSRPPLSKGEREHTEDKSQSYDDDNGRR